MKFASDSFFNSALTRKASCGCIFLNFYFTGFAPSFSGKRQRTISRSNPSISAQDQVKLIFLPKKNLKNSSFSSFDSEATKCMILGLSGIPKFISSIISTSNFGLYFSRGMSNLPSLGASKRFSPLDTSFIFTFSWSNGIFQFSPRDLILSFFAIFFTFTTRRLC